jgi:hypothetical protein
MRDSMPYIWRLTLQCTSAVALTISTTSLHPHLPSDICRKGKRVRGSISPRLRRKKYCGCGVFPPDYVMLAASLSEGLRGLGSSSWFL